MKLKNLKKDIVVLAVFLLMQCLDGVFTYIGISKFGLRIEANPILIIMISSIGTGPALITAKITASILGIFLHIRQNFNILLFLTGYYLGIVVPWITIYFYARF